jgi:hypothetical protein
MSRHHEVRQPVEVPEKVLIHLGVAVGADLEWSPGVDGSVVVRKKGGAQKFVEIASLPLEKQSGVIDWLRKKGRLETRARIVGDAHLPCGHPDSPENLIKIKEPGQREGRETNLCRTCNEEGEG